MNLYSAYSDIISENVIVNALMEVCHNRVCFVCYTNKTPRWRKGPEEYNINGLFFKVTMCNACYLKNTYYTRHLHKLSIIK